MASFEKNLQIQDAIIRNLEIIGEAATKIQRQAPEFVKAHPELPWPQMRGIRNKVIHDNLDIEISVVRSTVRDDLLKLKEQIDRLLIDLKHDPDRE